MKKFLILASVATMVVMVSCKGGGNNSSAVSSDSPGVQREVSTQVAYVNIDSLISRYEMFKDMSAKLQDKATKAEAELTAKGRSLERAVADAQDKAEKGLVTRAQLAELQEKLQRQEQSFYQHRDKVQGELAEENQVMMNNIYHSLNEFLAEFNSDYRYGMILSTSGGAPVLNADPQLDITEIIIKGLNETYSKVKPVTK